MSKKLALFIGWYSQGRDVEIELPIMYYLENKLGWKVEHVSMFNLPKILTYDPTIVLMPNTTGGSRQLEIARIVERSGFPLFSHVSEGMFREKHLDEFVWGAGKHEKRLSECMTSYWSDRCKLMTIERYPNLKNKIVVTGAIGFDKYQIKRHNSLRDGEYKKYIGVAGFDYHNIKVKKSEIIERNGLEYYEKFLLDCETTNNVLFKLIKNNPDIKFFLKSHPGDGAQKRSLEFEGLEKFQNTVFVERSICIQDVIGSSDIWISFNSSTNLEAWLMNKPSIAMQMDQTRFSSDLLNGAILTNCDDEIQSYIKEYYENENVIEVFEKKSKLRKSLIQKYIGYDDGFNHYRYVRHIQKFLDTAKIQNKPRWRVSRYSIIKSYLQHILYKIAKGKYNLPFLKKWAEYYDLYSATEIEQKKREWYAELEYFYKIYDTKYQNIEKRDNH